MGWECQKFLKAVRGGGARPAQGVGVGAANSRGERWVKICVMQAFREVFNIITIMLSKKQGRRHARDLNGVIPRAVLPKGYEKARRCFASFRSDSLTTPAPAYRLHTIRAPPLLSAAYSIFKALRRRISCFYRGECIGVKVTFFPYSLYIYLS